MSNNEDLFFIEPVSPNLPKRFYGTLKEAREKAKEVSRSEGGRDVLIYRKIGAIRVSYNFSEY